MQVEMEKFKVILRSNREFKKRKSMIKSISISPITTPKGTDEIKI